MRRFHRLIVVIFVLAVGPSVAAAGTPVQEWAEAYTGGSTDSPQGLAVAPNGDLCIAGAFYSDLDLGGGTMTSNGGGDIFVARYDADGNHLWSRSYGDTGYDMAHDVVVDTNGDVLVVGYFEGTIDFGGGPLTSAGADDIFLLRLSATGAYVWSRSFGDAYDQRGVALAVDAGGDIAVTGYFAYQVDFGGGTLVAAGGYDVFVAVFDAAGSLMWSQAYGDASDQYATSIVVDNQGYIVTSGYMAGTIDFGAGPLTCAGGWDAYLVRMKISGGVHWNRLVGNTSNDMAGYLVVDGDRNIYWSGRFFTTIDLGGGTLTSAGNYDLYLVKYDENGSHRWSTSFGDDQYQAGGVMSMPDDGTLHLALQSRGDVDMGGGVLECSGDWDVVAAKLDADGGHIWSGIYGDAGAQAPNGCVSTDDGAMVLAGYYEGDMDFGGGSLPYATSSDVFLAKLADPPIPLVTEIVDVANDQGRSVRLTFDPSRWDAPGAPATITGYEVYRRIDTLPDPAAKLSGWDMIGAWPAHGETEYHAVVPTLADSTIAQGMHWSVFLVRATTADPFAFYDSAPDSGYSLDNLAPGAPAGMSASYAAAGVALDWTDASETDFRYYRIYRSDSPDFVPTAGNLVHETATSDWTDPTANPWGLYYKITALDHAGNESAAGSPASTSDTPGGGVALRTELIGAAPNPFNPSTTLSFTLAQPGHARLTVYDVSGRRVAVLADAHHEAGRHDVAWNGRSSEGRLVAAGVYLYRLETPGYVETQRVMLVK